jgi:hypothetical protein
MCLYIKRDQKENKRDLQEFLGDQEKIFVYKILEKRPNEDFYRSLVYSHFTWNFSKERIFCVNVNSKPTKRDLEEGEVYLGFHTYTNLKIARERQYYSSMSIVKFKVKKQDIIAVENRADNPINCLDLRKPTPNFQRLVCRKLEFVEIL